MAEASKSKIDLYFEAWTTSLADLLSQLSATSWHSKAVAETTEGVEAITLECQLGKSLQGVQRLSVSREDASVLLSLFLGEPSRISAEIAATQIEALTELFRQWAGLAVARLKATFGEVSIELNPSTMVQTTAALSRLLCVQSDAADVSVRLNIDAALLAMLDRRAPVTTPIREPAAKNLDALLREGNLDLLLDVELGVTLRFGSRRAPLREVLELSPGAVLELNREIQEPVDLVLNERVIAQGDVVVIDGNYGLQITRVISPEQRLQAF